jgi:hypothetical protein
MAYRVIRLKKEARRNTKLDEIFQVTLAQQAEHSRCGVWQPFNTCGILPGPPF